MAAEIAILQAHRTNNTPTAPTELSEAVGDSHLGDGFGAILALDPSSAAVGDSHLGDGFGAILALDPDDR